MKTLAAAGLLALAAATSDAATISTAVTLTPAQSGAALLDVAAPDATTGTVFQNVTGSVSGLRRSPYDTIPGLASTGKYHSVSGGGSATYEFGWLQTGFSLLWGSPDSYNTLTFFKGVDQVDLGAQGLSLTGDEVGALASVSPLGGRFAFVEIGDILFDRVVFSSGQNAFEFGLVDSTPSSVPLPAAAWMLLAGLGALGAAARRRA